MEKICEFCHREDDTCLWVDFMVPQPTESQGPDDTVIMINVKKMVCDDCLMAMELNDN